MKFKTDGNGWRDLTYTDARKVVLTVSIPGKGQPGSGFIAVDTTRSHGLAAFLTRKKMRAFANKILKELDR